MSLAHVATRHDLDAYCAAQPTSTLFASLGVLDANSDVMAPAERMLFRALLETLETRLGVDVEDGFALRAQTHFEALLLAADNALLAA